MIKDAHDPRSFRRYVQFAADGTVASVHDFEAGATPMIGAVEVTDLSPIDFGGIAIDAGLVAIVMQSSQDVGAKLQAVTQAEADLSKSMTANEVAIGAARAALSVAAGKPKP